MPKANLQNKGAGWVVGLILTAIAAYYAYNFGSMPKNINETGIPVHSLEEIQ